MEIINQIDSDPKINLIQTQLGSMVTSFLNQINKEIERFTQPNTHGIFFVRNEEKEGFGVVQGNGNTTIDPNMSLGDFCDAVDEYQEDGEVVNAEWEQNDSGEDD
jgi:hypothetical protein